MKSLFQMYFLRDFSSETQCRRIVKNMETEAMETCVEVFKFRKIFANVDEPSISVKKNVHFFVGKQCHLKLTKLVEVKMVENTFADSVTYLLDDVLRQLKIERNGMLLLHSDAAAYMKSAEEMLKIIYPRMFHLPCFCYLLHNVCMTVKTTQYSAINDIIASINACTVKNKTRQEMFYHLGTIPDPAVTRWGPGFLQRYGTPHIGWR